MPFIETTPAMVARCKETVQFWRERGGKATEADRKIAESSPGSVIFIEEDDDGPQVG